jgi:hypothetical protein
VTAAGECRRSTFDGGQRYSCDSLASPRAKKNNQNMIRDLRGGGLRPEVISTRIKSVKSLLLSSVARVLDYLGISKRPAWKDMAWKRFSAVSLEKTESTGCTAIRCL